MLVKENWWDGWREKRVPEETSLECRRPLGTVLLPLASGVHAGNSSTVQFPGAGTFETAKATWDLCVQGGENERGRG